MMTLCKQCGKYFSTESGLSRHCNSSCPLQRIQKCYECYDCGQIYPRKDTLVMHIHCRHMFEERSFECYYCSKKFTLKHNLIKHIRQIHIAEKKKQLDKVCKRCCKDFATVNGLRRHNLTVHGKRIQLGRTFLNVVEAPFECDECNKKFTRRDNLLRHIKYHHIMKKKSFACPHCSRKYSVPSDLKTHIRSRHCQNVVKFDKITLDHSLVKEFKCLLCAKTFDMARHINEHYEKDHLIVYIYEYFEFASLMEFENWLNKKRSKYIQCHVKSQWETDTHFTKVFRCHCSRQKYETIEPKKGSKKLTGFCPMRIVLKESKIDGKCSVKYQKTHVGHSCDETEVPYMRLNEKEKFEVGNKISLEVTKSTILTQNQTNTHQESYSHLNTSSMQFLDKRCSSILNDDLINIRNFVTKNKDSVLFYKVQGEYDECFPTLAKDDFALGYMDNNQKQALTRYGHKIVAFNGTYGENPTDFILHSMSVQDVDHEAYPVAFLLSNRYDKFVINILLQHIKQRVGIIKPKAIMSDMQHFYFNAWTEEMGPVQNRLYCIWYVYEEWRRNYSKINYKELREIVKKQVENLSREYDKELFEQKLNNLMRNYDVNLLHFLKYFCKFVYTKEYWAYCYRNHIGYNTNMGVERFFNTFKDRIAGGMKVKNVYECLCLLQTYLKRIENDIEKTFTSRKICPKTRILRKDHKTAEDHYTLEEIFIKQITHNCWQVQYFADTDNDILVQELFTVQKLEVKECTQYSDMVCALLCTKCKICHHDFVCTCHKNVIRNYMCKHIHMLGIYLLNQKLDEDELAQEEDFNQEEITLTEDTYQQKETEHTEDFNSEEMIYLDEDSKEEQMVHVDEDFNQEQIEIVYIGEDFNQKQMVLVDGAFNQENLTDKGSTKKNKIMV